MSYQVLARKYRSASFSELVGQEHVSKALSNAIEQERLHHAYLFTGTRGVGKTTIARILAKCLNCLEGVTANPCGKCEHCVNIDSGSFVDLIEVDAASKTKVEDTRELLDNVQYAPVVGRYKVYLIDEVHMLSGHSFNALLKTLEEPPEHVKFLLATTEHKKLPITILSRCLRFNLRPLTISEITSHMEYILGKETIGFEREALEVIASAANGSMRDALSILDQAIGFSAANISYAAVNKMLGNTDAETLLKLLKSLSEEKANSLFEVIDFMDKQGVDYQQVVLEFVELIHNLAIAKALGSNARLMLKHKGAEKLIDSFDEAQLQLFYQIALKCKDEMQLAPSLRIGFEMLMLRMFKFEIAIYESDNGSKPLEAQRNISKETNSSPTNAKLVNTKPVQAAELVTRKPINMPVETKIESHAQEQVKAQVQTQAATPIKEDAINNNSWPNIVTDLNPIGMNKVILENSALKEYTGNKIHLVVALEQEACMTPLREGQISKYLSSYFNKTIALEVSFGDIGNHSIAGKNAAIKQEKDTELKAKINKDENIQSMIDVLGAKVIGVQESN